MTYSPPIVRVSPTPVSTITDTGYGISQILSGSYAPPAETQAPNAPPLPAPAGVVSSVALSGGTTGLTATGSPVTSAGTITLGGTLAVANGGLGFGTAPPNGTIPIGNGSTYTLNTLTAGSGITVTNTAGTITIASASGGGSVTSVSATGGTTGLSFSGSPITGAGTLSLAGTLVPANGGLGVTTTPANGAIPIGNGTSYSVGTLTAGTGIAITNTAGGISIDSTTSGGSVTSVAASGGSTGLSFSGSPITTAGTFTLSGTLAIANGGLGSVGTPANGTFLVGNGSSYTLKTFAAGSGISIVNGSSTVTFSTTAATLPVGLYLCNGSFGIPNATYVRVPLNYGLFDTNGGFYSDAYTANVAGYYTVQATIAVSCPDGLSNVALTLKKNGTNVSQSEYTGAFASGMTSYNSQIATIVPLNALDNVELYVYATSNSGNNITFGGGVTPYSSFMSVACLRPL